MAGVVEGENADVAAAAQLEDAPFTNFAQYILAADPTPILGRLDPHNNGPAYHLS